MPGILGTLQALTDFGLGAWGQVATIQNAAKSAKAVQSGQAAPVIIQAAAPTETRYGSSADAGPVAARGMSTNTLLLIGGAALAAVLILPKLMRSL